MIGASAGTATWSGWVGLGELTGFGVVHPLPGIADSLTINTAVTLPIGVEAYAMYALSIATSSRTLPIRTRRYAWASSGAALLLGMAGQVAYHVMTAHDGTAEPIGYRLAPWWVIAVVSCLPVLVLGAASLLWHLAGQPEPAAVPVTRRPAPSHEPDSETETEPPTGTVPQTRTGLTPEPVPVSASPSHETELDPATELSTERDPSRGPETAPATASGPALLARPDDVTRIRAAIRTGDLPAEPSVAAIRTHLGIGTVYARAARTTILDGSTPAAAATTEATDQLHTGNSPADEYASSSDDIPEMTEPLITDDELHHLSIPTERITSPASR